MNPETESLGVDQEGSTARTEAHAAEVLTAARQLLKRLDRKQAINYAVRCVEGPTFRGREFWNDVLRTLELGDPE